MNYPVKSNKPALPAALVQYAARELMKRAEPIKVSHKKLHEISTAPLPIAEWKVAYPRSRMEQTFLSHVAAAQTGWLQRMKQNMGASTQNQLTWSELNSEKYQPTQAALVFAPMVLDLSDEVLNAMALMPNWFSADGVLLFTTLANGSLPELVNAQPEWLNLFGHWHNIMDVGARLQALNFGLPVLDVETVTLSYSEFDTMWCDLVSFLPLLHSGADEEQEIWRQKALELFNQGLRSLSLEVLYGQVWQPTIKAAKTEHTVSLESLTNQLTKRHYPS